MSNDANSFYNVEVLDTTLSTNTSTGSLIVSGGLGISGDIYGVNANLDNISTNSIISAYATIPNLNSVNVTLGNLSLTNGINTSNATISNLNSANATLGNLLSNIGTVSNLFTNNIDNKNLISTNNTLSNLISTNNTLSNLRSLNIATIGITSATLNVTGQSFLSNASIMNITTGNISITGTTSVSTPVNESDATTKTYVDVAIKNVLQYYTVSNGTTSTNTSTSDTLVSNMSLIINIPGIYAINFNSDCSIPDAYNTVGFSTNIAKSDLNLIYNDIVALTPVIITHPMVFGTGEILNAGIYHVAGAVSIAGTLTLDGGGNTSSVFVIKSGGAFNTGAGVTVTLINGARPKNIFWVAQDAIGLGANTIISGTILSNTGAVAVGADCNLSDARLFTKAGAISFGPGTLSRPIGTSIINFRTLENFIIFTGSGGIANASTSTYTGDIATDLGAITGFSSSTVNGTIYQAGSTTTITQIHHVSTFSLYVNDVFIQNSSRLITQKASIVSLQDVVTLVAGDAIRVKCRMDTQKSDSPGQVTTNNKILTINNLLSNTGTISNLVSGSNLSVSNQPINNLSLSNLISTNATLSNLLLPNGLTVSNLISTNTTLNNLLSNTGTISSLVSVNLLNSNATINNLSLPNGLTVSNLANTNIISTNVTINNLSLPNGLTVSNLNNTNIISTNATLNNLLSNTGIISSLASINLLNSNATINNLLLPNGLTVSNLNNTNIISTNATLSNLLSNTGTISSLVSINLLNSNATINNLSLPNGLTAGSINNTNIVSTNATLSNLNSMMISSGSISVINSTMTNLNVISGSVGNLLGINNVLNNISSINISTGSLVTSDIRSTFNTLSNLFVSNNITSGSVLISNSTKNSLIIDCKNSTTNNGEILFKNSSGTGDYRISGDGGDAQWICGGTRSLQMGSSNQLQLRGGRGVTSNISQLSGTGTINNTMIINESNSIGLTIQGSSGQTADLQQWTNNTGGTLATINSSGDIYSRGYLLFNYTQFIKDESDTSTSGTIPIRKLILTTPNIPAGNYFFSMSCTVSTNSTNRLFNIEYRVDSVIIETRTQQLSNTSANLGLIYDDIISLSSGVHTLELYFYRTGSQTITIGNAKIMFYRFS